MNQKRKLSLAGVGALGAAALLLSGCGGNSSTTQTFGNYAEVVPVAYGLDPIAINQNLQPQGGTIGYELSGLGSPDGKTAYLTAATAFNIVKNSGGAALPVNVDSGLGGTTPQLPYGFSTGGVYIDNAAGVGVPAAAVLTGASVTFRAALANGVANNASPPIASATLSSTDPQWTLGTLPLTFNDPKSGPLANGTYVTGTGGNPTPFTLPFTQGIHTVVVTVTDAVGRVTATTFEIPVAAAASTTVFLQNITRVVPATPATATAPAVPAATKTFAVTPGDLVSLDGGTAVTADAQGTAILFTTPGTHTVTETKPDKTAVQSATFTLAATTAGKTVYDVVDNAVPPAAPPATAKARRPAALRRH